MKVLNFVTISTDGQGERINGGVSLKHWKFIDVRLVGGTQQNFRREQDTPPTRVMIRERMLFLYFD